MNTEAFRRRVQARGSDCSGSSRSSSNTVNQPSRRGVSIELLGASEGQICYAGADRKCGCCRGWVGIGAERSQRIHGSHAIRVTGIWRQPRVRKSRGGGGGGGNLRKDRAPSALASLNQVLADRSAGFRGSGPREIDPHGTRSRRGEVSWRGGLRAA